MKLEFYKETEIFKINQVEIKVELINTIIQLEKSRESLTLDQIEARISGLNDKVEELDHTGK